MIKQVLLTSPKNISISETGTPEPQESEALVRLRLGGICGSDLAAYQGTSPLVTYPRVLGHELVVDVITTPAGQPGWNGRRAVVEPLLACGNCHACRQGRYNCCMELNVLGVHVDGGFQEVFAVKADRLHVVPDDMPDELAVLAEPLSIAYRAVQRSRIEAGQRAVVFGAGTIGLLIAHLLIRARGCRVYVVDIDPDRLERAQAIGATALNSNSDPVVETIHEMTNGDMAEAVFEATGHPACTRLTTELVAFAGTIVLIGWNPTPVEMDTVTLMRKEARLLGSRNSNNAFPAVLRLLADGIVDPKVLITHEFPMEDTEKALDLLSEGREHALKIIIRP